MFENTYDEDIHKFEKISSSKGDELLENEELAIIYIGRGSCPYCRRFAKKLSALSNEINSTIYYIDSEDFSDDNIEDFREKYSIITVPGFIVGKNGVIDVRCDSSTPEEELLEMIK
ncbi:MAG: thiol reductase thioredoxin [Sarcina sp.]